MRGGAFVATLCLLLAVPSNGISKKKRHKKNDNSAYERRLVCQANTCGHLVPLEATNCVNECVSPDCYRKIFKEPLEDGEVNMQLSKSFNACARRETRSTAFSQKRSRNQFSDTKNAATAGTKPAVAREESVVLPTGMLEENAAELVLSLDGEEEEEEDGEDFDEEKYD